MHSLIAFRSGFLVHAPFKQRPSIFWTYKFSTCLTLHATFRRKLRKSVPFLQLTLRSHSWTNSCVTRSYRINCDCYITVIAVCATLRLSRQTQSWHTCMDEINFEKFIKSRDEGKEIYRPEKFALRGQDN